MPPAQSLLTSFTMFYTVTKSTLAIALGAVLTMATAVLLSKVIPPTIQWLDQHFDNKKDEKHSSAQKDKAEDGTPAPVIAAVFSAFGYVVCLLVNIESESVIWMVVNSWITVMGIALGLTLAALTMIGLLYGAARVAEKFGKS